MRELVGECGVCGKELFCLDGFFEGITVSGVPFCHGCQEPNALHTFDVKELAAFIASMNQKDLHHVGYCGVDASEIEDTLTNDFSDMPLEESFAVMYEGKKLIAALGLDWDDDEKTGELWGPFIDRDETEWKKHANVLLASLNSSLGAPAALYGFYNQQNNRAKKWMNTMGAKQRSSDIVLHATRSSADYSTHPKIEECTARVEKEFTTLHDSAFPNTYYSAETLLKRRNDQQKLFVYLENHSLLGYVYVEGNPDHKEGSIEYIAVDPSGRKKGIGAALLKQALTFLFTEMNVEQISICVSTENEAAIHLYKKVGFVEKHELVFLAVERA